MKSSFRVNRPRKGERCDLHPGMPAAYVMNAEVMGVHLRRAVCSPCLCRHFHLETYFSIEEGLQLPRGLFHKRE